jgi:hypothetical protein
MSKQFDSLDKALDIEVIPIATEVIQKVKKEIVRPISGDDVESDYSYSRENLYKLNQDCDEVILELMEIAKYRQNARDFEVLAQLFKTKCEINDRHIDLQQKMKKLKEEEKQNTPSTVNNNALFIGTTAELQKFIKSQDKK